MAANQEIDALLQELGRLVSSALAGSEQLTVILDRLYRQGYSLRFEVDGGSDRNNLKLVLTPRTVPGLQIPVVPAAGPAAEAPVKPYRLDAGDVALLRSLGIDGTRRAKPARRS